MFYSVFWYFFFTEEIIAEISQDLSIEPEKRTKVVKDKTYVFSKWLLSWFDDLFSENIKCKICFTCLIFSN